MLRSTRACTVLRSYPFLFFFNATATTEIYTLSLHDALPISPTYMPVGDLDLFLQENIDYAQKLTRAGVPIHFHIYPGAFHGFNGFAAEAPVSQHCNAEIFSFIGKLLSEAAR